MRGSDALRIETERREPAAVFFVWGEKGERSEEQSFSTLVQYGVELQSAADARRGASDAGSRQLLDCRKAGGWLDRGRRKRR